MDLELNLKMAGVWFVLAILTPILVTRFEATTKDLVRLYQDSITRLISEAEARLDEK